MTPRLDSLAARIALGVLSLVASVIVISVVLVALSLRAQVEESLGRELSAAGEGADAMFAARGELIEAIGGSLAGAPMFRAAIAADTGAATLKDMVEDRRKATKLDLVALFDPDFKLSAASPAFEPTAELQNLQPGTPSLVMLGGALYLAVLHEMEAGPRVLGYTLAGQRIGPNFAQAIAHQTGVEVLIASGGKVLGSALTSAAEADLLAVSGAGAHEVGSLHAVALDRGPLKLVLAQNSDVEFARFRQTLVVLVLAGLVGAVLAGLIGLVVVRRALSPLDTLTKGMLRMVDETDFTKPLELKSTQEVRMLAQAFQDVVSLLRRVLSQIRAATARIGAGTDAMVSTVSRSESAASDHATSIRHTSEASGELARSARQIAQSSGSVAEIAQKTLSSARQGLEGAAAFTEAMTKLRSEHKRATQVMTDLSGRMQQIGRVVEFINDVADKSELLALNAELEGQRAGAVGQSFSLVATEMRRLAENVTRSTREIETLIEDVKTATREAVGATQAGLQASERAAAAASAVSGSLTQITSMAERTASQVDEISSSTQAQTNSMDQLARSLTKLQSIAQETLEATRNLAGANSDLSVLAHELDQLVVSFKV